MGTRSITVVTQAWEGNEEDPDHKAEPDHIATIYRHWDGYLTGHGQWLAAFLKDAVVTNGKKLGEDGSKNFNGPGRLASGIVAAMVDDDLDPDLMEQGSVCGQEYEYRVHVEYGMSGGSISVRVLDGPMTAFGCGGEDCSNEVFSGTVEEFGAFVEDALTLDKAGT